MTMSILYTNNWSLYTTNSCNGKHSYCRHRHNRYTVHTDIIITCSVHFRSPTILVNRSTAANRFCSIRLMSIIFNNRIVTIIINYNSIFTIIITATYFLSGRTVPHWRMPSPGHYGRCCLMTAGRDCDSHHYFDDDDDWLYTLPYLLLLLLLCLLDVC